MSKKRVSTLRQRLTGLVAATAAIFLPTWAMSEQASAAIDETPTTSTTTTVVGQTEWTGAPLIPTIPPTIPTTTIPVPITFPPSPSTTAYPDPNPNAPEDCSDVNVEIKCSTTTTSTSTTTSTIPPTTTTSTIPVTTSTTSTTSTTVPPTTTTSTSTTVPPTTTTATTSTTLAPTTTAAPVVVTPTTRPQPTLAVTGSSNSKPMAGAALIALAGGLGMVAFAEKQKLKETPATAYTRPLGQATPTKTYRSSSNIVPPISSRSALTLVAPVRTVNIPVIEVREIAKPVVAVDAAPKMLELEAAPVTVSRDAHRLARAEAELLREFPAPVTIELQDLSSRLGFNAIAL